MHLASGACPVLPLVLFSIGFLIAAAVNLNAFTLARDRNPGLPGVSLDLFELRDVDVKIAAYVECWGSSAKSSGLGTGVCS